MAPPKEEMKNGEYQKQDIVALRKCIRHWKEDNVGEEHRGNIDLGPTNCALCELYTEGALRGCEDCPVCHKTGAECCVDSPYTKVSDLMAGWRNTRKKPKDFEKAVAAEIAFLEGLLKEAEAQFKKGVV